jgi:protein-tyrosine phosphatase
MGNICRSPAAESFFRNAVINLGVEDQFFIDSAGTGGWHEGNPPDKRMMAGAKKVGLTIDGYARKITKDDLSTFDWIFCMDKDNYDDVVAMGGNTEKTRLLLPFVGHTEITEVPDPYYGGEEGFDTVISLVNQAVETLATMLKK